MLTLLKVIVTLALFIFGLQIALSSTIITAKHRSLEEHNNNELDGTGHQVPFHPSVGLYVKNYAGKVITTVGSSVGEEEHLILALPVLKVEDHIWEGKSITLECWSEDHPVYWEYRGLGVPKVRVMTERKAPSFYNVTSYRYGAIITFSSTNYRQTGEYSCRPVDLGGNVRGVSLYLFAPGKKIFVISGEDDEEGANNKTVKVSADEDSSWVTLPCAVADKGAGVELFAVNGEGGLKRMGVSDAGVEFDPLEGFRLKWKGFGAVKSPWGSYVCVGSNGKIKEEKVHLILKGPGNSANKFSVLGSQSSTGYAPKVSILYNPSDKRIECCSSIPASRTRRSRSKRQAILPRMKLSPCVSISDCYFSSANLASDSSFCQGSGECSSDSFIKRLNDSCVAYELPEIHEAGVLDCSLDGDDALVKDAKIKDQLEAQIQFSYEPGLGLVTKFDSEETETSEILGIGREQEGGNSQPQFATYFCRANSFFFSTGIKWAVERRNQNGLEFLGEEDARSTVKVDETKISRVFCFAPIWDSQSTWRNVSMIVPSSG